VLGILQSGGSNGCGGTIRKVSGLSLTARALVDGLTAGGSRSSNVARIRDIAALGECAVIPYLAPMLVAGSTAEIAAVGEAIASLLNNATTEDLFRLDVSFREYAFCTQDDSPWRRFDVSRIPRGDHSAASSVLVKLLSMHANGRVREAAVMSLDAIHDGTEIPFLLLRLNDWVPQVRARARAVVAARMTPESARSFVVALPFLVRLLGARRADHQDLLNSIAKVITASPDARDALIVAMSGDDRGLRRAALRVATFGNATDFEAFILPGSKMADPVIRLFVARAAAAALPDSERLALLLSFANDSFAPVRQVALVALAANYPKDAEPSLEWAVRDRSASIRDLARFQLRKRHEVDFAHIYREALICASVVRLVVAIAGLGEVGAPSDAESILKFLSHRSARVRRASVRAVAQLGGETFLRDVLPRLHDPVQSVASTASTCSAATLRRSEARNWLHDFGRQSSHFFVSLCFV
jgi:hypothetical protein